MIVNSNALIFWIAVIVAVVGLALKWWPIVVIAGFYSLPLQWRWVGTDQADPEVRSFTPDR
jgi:hypothetical protein